MAFITNATRKVVIDHVVATLGRAPTTAELADVTVLLNDGASLADVAGYLTTSAGYLAKYPVGQTPSEIGADIIDAAIVGGVLTADLRLAIIDLIAGGLTSGAYTIASATNAVVAYLSDTANNDNADLGDIAKAFQNRTAAAEKFTTTFTLEGVTVTEADLAAAVEGVTSDAATLTAATAAFEAGNKSIAAQVAADKAVADAAAAKAAEEKAAADKAAADAAAAKAAEEKAAADAAAAKAAEEKAAADAAAAKAAEEKAAADKAAADKAAEEKAAADAAAAEKVLTDAADAAAADAATAIEAAEAADAELATAKTASEAAATKAALTDATALTAVTTTATTADTDAKAAVVTAQTAYDAALVAAVPADVVTKQGELLIAQNQALLAAEALATAKTASDAATADDEAAATAATAYETALEAANTAGEAAETAAAAAVTAAAATADTDDDTAAAAQVTEAAAATTTADDIAAAAQKVIDDAAAAQKVIDDAAAAQKVIDDAAAAEALDVDASTLAAATATQAIADSATANAEATTANAAIVDNATAAAAVVKATAAVTAAAAATSAVNAYVTAAAATDDAADDAAAAALVTTAASQATTADSLSTTAAAEAAIDRAAQAFTLTTGVNLFTGGMGPDTFDGSQSNSLNTLTSGDNLDGGEGTDTLFATLGATTLSVNTSNIEKLSLTATGAATLNASASTGIEEIASNASTAALTINGLNSVPSLTLNSNSNATTLSFNNAALASASDSITINLEGVTDAAGAGTGDITLARSSGATNDLESVTLNSSVVANSVETLNVGGVDTATLNVTGDQNLTITDPLDTDISTVNASSFTGALTAKLSATTTSFTGGSGADDVTRGGLLDNVSMGAGNDIIRTSDANFDKTSTIAGGDGTDSLVAVGDTIVIDTDFTLVSSVETLTAVADDALTVTLGAKAAAAGLATVTMADTAAADDVTVGSAFTNDLTVNLSADGASNVVDATGYTKALTVSGKISTMDGNAPTITGGSGTSDSLVIQIDETDDALLGGLTAVEQITVTDAAATSNHTTSVDLDDANATYTSAAVYETLTVDATAIGADGDTVNIDATAELDAKVILKGGDGVNNITLSASANFGDTVTAGAGKDTISFATANLTSADIIDGGDDSDTLVSVDNATVVDADFTNVTNVEAISGTASFDLDLTLGSLADAAGIRTVTFTDEASTGDTVTIGKTFTSAITVVLDDNETATSAVDASAYVGAGLTVKANISDLVDADGTNNSTITGSANTNDNYNIVIDAAGGTMESPAALTNVETITVTDGVAATNATAGIVLADANATYTNTETYQTITVDATAIGASGDTVNIDASGEQDAKVVIDAGDGVNTITLSTSANFGDSVTAGGGKDVIIAGASNLTAADVIDGGDGADTLKVNADAALLDAAFTGVTSVETLTGTATTIAVTATLGALAQASGLATILLSDTGAAETITVGAGFTRALTIDLDGDDTTGNTVSATAYTGNLTVTALASEMDGTASTLTGGTGSDTLQVTSVGADDTVTISGLTNFETITLVDDGDATADTLSLTVADATVASGATLTIDGSGLLVDDITVDLSSETNGVNVVKGGAGVDLITASASTSGDNLQGNGGNDVFSIATKNFTSADTIDGGAGDDTIKMTDASTVIDADFTNVTSVKTLTYGTAGNNQSFTVGALAAAAGISVITTGTGTNTVTFAANNGATTVNLAAGTDTVNAAAATEAVTVVIAETSLTAADTLTGGTGSDILSLTSDAGTGNFTNVSGFETLKTTANNATGITTVDGNVADGGSMTVNALSLTTTVLTFDGSAELDGSFAITAGGTGDHQVTLGQGNDSYTSTSTAGEDVTATAGNNTIRTGDGDDIIIGGSGDDSMYGEAGADTFQFTSANFTSADTVSGGAGADTIEMTDDSIVTDSDFTNVTSVKTLTASAAKNLTATLGANAAAAGISAVTLVDGGAANTVTLSAGLTSAVNVTLSDDDTAGDVVGATAYTGALTVTASDENLDANASTLTGGTGTNTLAVTLTADNTLLLDSVSGFDTITLTGDDNASDTATITLADAVVAKGETLTINGSGLNQATNDAKLVFDGSAETNGSYIITTAGDQAHSVTLGNGADTYTGSGSGDTAVTGTAGANTITTGTGADTITAGSGADTMTGGTGNDIFAFGSAANASGDSITDFVSANDQIGITLDYSALLSGVVVNGVRTSTGVAGSSAAEATFTGQRGEYVYDTTNSKLIVNANADASVSGADFQIGINAATTAANTIAAGEVNFTVTGTGYADTILTSGGADVVDGGIGNDTITGGGGVDTLTGSAGDDVFTYNANTDGGMDLLEITATDGTDDFTVTAGTTHDSLVFVQADDKIKIDGALETSLEASAAIDISSNTANLDYNAAGIFLIATAQAQLDGDNFGDVSDIITNFNIGNGTVANTAAGDEIIFTIDNDAATQTGVYYFKDVDGDGDMGVGDIIGLLAVVSVPALAAANFTL